MNGDRFSVSEDEDLIEMVATRKVLWDSSHKDFKNIIKKDLLWTEIGEVMCKTKTQCKQRWKSIRDHYRKTRKHLPGSAGGKKRALYWSRLQFLETVEDDRPPFTGVVVMSDDEDTVPATDHDSRVVSTVMEASSLSPSTWGESKVIYDYPPHSNQPPLKKGRKDHSFRELLQAGTEDRQNHVKTYLNHFVDHEPELEDETTLFFKTIAATVKKFNPDLANEAKTKIFSMVMEFEIRNRRGSTATSKVSSRTSSPKP